MESDHSFMKSKGPLYVGTLNYYHNRFLPIVEVGHTQETELPFRKGKCLVFRVPFTTTGYYFGILYGGLRPEAATEETIDELLSHALKARVAWTPKDGAYDEAF